MLGRPTEIRGEVGIWIWRDVIDSSLADDFAAESLETLLIRLDPGTFPPDRVYSLGSRANLACEAGGPATSKVLRLLGRTSFNDGVNFLYYPAGVIDCFHTDSCDIVDSVQSNSGRVLDIAPRAWTPEEAENNFVTIELSPRDVVRQWMSGMFHRGRNVGDVSCIAAATRHLPSFENRFGR